MPFFFKIGDYPSFTSVSQHDVSIAAEAVDILLLPLVCGYLDLPSLAPASQHDVSIAAEAVDLLLLPGVNPKTGPFQGHPIIPKTFSQLRCLKKTTPDTRKVHYKNLYTTIKNRTKAQVQHLHCPLHINQKSLW